MLKRFPLKKAIDISDGFFRSGLFIMAISFMNLEEMEVAGINGHGFFEV